MTSPAGLSSVLSRLQIQVSRRLDGLLQGDYLGLLPGPGSESGESREYREGDDVRRMDWPVTARTTVPHVRLTIADRELETWLAVDLSPSVDFGTAWMSKRDLALAATVALTQLTVRGGNRVGMVATSGAGLLRRPARSGHREAQGLLRALASLPSEPVPADLPPTGRSPVSPAASTARAPGGASGVPAGGKGLGELVEALNKPVRRRGLAVVVSDFLDPVARWERPLRRLGVRHETLAIEVVDPRELELPDVGVLELLDPETGMRHEIQTSDAKLRVRYAKAAQAQRSEIADALRGAGARHLRLRTDQDWLQELVRFVVRQRRLRGNR